MNFNYKRNLVSRSTLASSFTGSIYTFKYSHLVEPGVEGQKLPHSLPPSKGFDAIMVVVDRFSKMAHFIPTRDEATAQETGRLFFSHIFKHHGLPKDIVSDQDSKFTSKFWQALWKRMGSELKMSTSFRP